MCWNLDKELQSLFNFCPPFCLSELKVRAVNHFNFTFLHSISLFCTQFHLFALNFTFLHWFGINWHALNQSECRNCCLYIITLEIIWLPVLTSSNQRLWECVRRLLNFYTDTLNDFPSWLSTSKNQPFFINNRCFTVRYFSDKVHAILIEEARCTYVGPLTLATLHDITWHDSQV